MLSLLALSGVTTGEIDDLVRDMTLPNGRATRTVGSPIRINGEPIPHETRPPALGEDTEALKALFRKD